MSTTSRPSLDDVRWPRRTERLTLRRGVARDAEAIFAYRRLEEVGRWLTHVQTDPIIWETRWAERLGDTIVVEHDGAVIGDTRIVVNDAHTAGDQQAEGAGREAELAWAFDPAWHGQGYATETVEDLIEISFSVLGLRRLTAHCYLDNAASWRLMERVGMRRETHAVRSVLSRDGRWHDFLGYAVLAPGQ